MSALVQIQDFKFPQQARVEYNYGYREAQSFSPLQVANMRRHRLIEKLVPELSAMFGRIGMHEVCGRCFRQELTPKEREMRAGAPIGYYAAQGGCCGSCSMLGHNSCLNKPLACAHWMCSGITQKMWPKTAQFMRELTSKLACVDVLSNVYSSGIVKEHFLKPNLAQRRALRECIREVRAWNEARVEQP